MNGTNSNIQQHIAVIGYDCRFPGANNANEYWDNLVAGKESVTIADDDILRGEGVEDSQLADPDYVKAYSNIEDGEAFDATFFYLSAREAEKMDPQLRVFLETAWKALESSGYNSENYGGDIGVFASSLGSSYLLNNLLTSKDAFDGDVQGLLQDMVARMGNDSNYLATRTSYHLNLTGPSVSVQTACSSSLVAVHQAVESLLSGECDMALAGGVSMRFPRKSGYLYQRDGILSKDGHCRPFDANASGTIFGEGAGVVVLKRLEDALQDGDTIHAVVVGSATGNDGSDKVGYTAPSVNGQARVIEEALQVAQVDKASIEYIEAHGTGTKMGDPIELESLNKVFKVTDTNGTQPEIALGSVKGNFGHLSIAAGIAGFIKVVLMLQNKTLAPTVNFSEPNPECNFEGSPFSILTKGKTWDCKNEYRYAGVSSFGMGGSNVHMVLQEAPVSEPLEKSRALSILPLSAKSPEILTLAEDNAQALLSEEKYSLPDIAYTYAAGRRTFNFRSLLVAGSDSEAVSILTQRQPGQLLTGTGQPEPQPITFLFPGQGAQYPNMGSMCYQEETLFRRIVDNCCEILKSYIDVDLREIIYPDLFPSDGPVSRLNETRYTQPALFVVEFAMAQLWISWGIQPTKMIGHSVGEYVAACIAGVFSLEDALAMIAKRGELIQSLPKGSMLAVSLSAEKLQTMLVEGTEIAAINEPDMCTAAGPEDAIKQLMNSLSEEGIMCRKVVTSHAFHTAMMDPARKKMLEIVSNIELHAPTIQVISNLSGELLTEQQATSPQYWADHLRNTVNFAGGIDTLLRNEKQILLEVGPGQTLASFVRRHPDKELNHTVLTSLGRNKQAKQEYKNLLTTVGRFWLTGIEVDWNSFYQQEKRKRVPVPTYAFSRERYFVEPNKDFLATSRPGKNADKKQPLVNWFYVPSWKQSNAISLLSNSATTARDDENNINEAEFYLLFEDQSGLGNLLATRLKKAGHRVAMVSTGNAFKVIGSDRYQLQPSEFSDYRLLLETLQTEGEAATRFATPNRIIHLWSADPVEGELDHASFERDQIHGIYSLVMLTKAIADLNITHPIQLQVVTCNAYPVTGLETIAPGKTTSNVIAKVIAQEFAHIDSQLIDIDLALTEQQRNVLCDRLLEELDADSEREFGIAYRGGRRWVQKMERLSQLQEWNYQQTTRLEKNGSYLITGGLGEIGTTIAIMLAEKYQAQLALLVREAFPAENEWQAWLESHDDDDLVSQRIHTVRKLEALGSKVTVVSADVADQRALDTAMDKIITRFGQLDGVIHAAGLPGEIWDRTIENAGVEQIQWHFRSKAYGLMALAKSVEVYKPKFCLLISSLASVLGGLRLGPYGAANHFMDNAAALFNQQQSDTYWITADWDVWQHHQDEKRESSALGKMMDERTVLPEQGLEAIERLLALQDIYQVSISTWDLEERSARWIKLKSIQQSTAVNNEVNLSKDEIISEGFREGVLSILHDSLGNSELQYGDDFFEAGGDSLISVQILSSIRQNYGVDVSLAQFLNEPTANTLISLIQGQIQSNENVIELMEQNVAVDEESEVQALLANILEMSEESISEALLAE